MRLNNINKAIEWVRAADYVLIGAGAGMGVDSGMPDFRGNEGFWNAYPKFRHLGMSFSQMANPEWFEKDPAIAWGFYGHRYNLYHQTPPHNGFSILKRICEGKKDHFIFTSNVDGHFQQAGFSEENIIECHGSISHWQCTEPCSNHIWHPGEVSFFIDNHEMRCLDELPRCGQCGAIARPNILMFGDWHWLSDRTNQQQKHYESFLKKARKGNLVVLEFGAGTAIPTVRYECESAGRNLIRVNPRDYQAPMGSESFASGALAFLEELAAGF